MKVEERYYNITRPNQIVKIVKLENLSLEYLVEQPTSDNPIKQFACSKQRFKNLYKKITLSQSE